MSRDFRKRTVRPKMGSGRSSAGISFNATSAEETSSSTSARVWRVSQAYSLRAPHRGRHRSVLRPQTAARHRGGARRRAIAFRRKCLPASVDVVFCSNFFEHLPDKQTFLPTLTEIRTVLRPGGRLLFCSPTSDWSAAHTGTSSIIICRLPIGRSWRRARASGFDIVEVIPRFLPYTTRSGLPQSPWLVRLYLAVRPAWRLLGGQTWMVARKPSAGPGRER